MVMILPKQPSFGEQFGAALGAGAGQGISNASEFHQKMQLEKQKQKSYEGIFGTMGQQGNQEKKEFPKLDDNQKAYLALTDPQAFKAYEVLEQGHIKKEEKAHQKQNLTDVIEDMSKTLLKGNLGITHKKYTKAEGRRDAQYFDSLNTELESIGKEMVTKGTLSNTRFAFLLGNLPSSDKTDAANAGALQAWVKELELDVPGIEDLKTLYEKPAKKGKKKSTLKNVTAGTPLTAEALKEIIDTVGEDKAKATAKKMGYAFND
jgi:hypothetical protein